MTTSRFARLSSLVATEPTVLQALQDRSGGLTELDLQAPEPLRPFLTQALATQSTVLAVTATASSAAAWAASDAVLAASYAVKG